MPALYVEFGRMVRAARHAESLSQADLGRMVGLSRASIANIEAGRQHVALDQLFDLATALGLQPRELLPIMKTAREVDALPGLDTELERQGIDASYRPMFEAIMQRALARETDGSAPR